MTDIMSRDKRSRLMTAVKGRGNLSTEESLARLFRERRVRGWRRHTCLAGSWPDFVFPTLRIAVFADGCFWHGCPRHYTKPASHSRYWREKVLDNKARDQRVASRLRRDGWSVWRVWECRIRAGTLPSGLITRLLDARC